jgi:hypothetical protein
MAKDVLITPASGNVEFKLDGTTKASLSLDNFNNLILSTTDGDVTIGTPGTDVYIGDGVNSVDIIFEQSGKIRALTGKTLTLGQADSFVAVGTSLSVTGNVTGGNFIGTLNGSGANVSSINATNIASGTLAVLRGGTGVTTSTGTGSVVLGTSPTFTTQITVPAIVKSGTNGVGNIGAAASTFNTVFAKATSAQYADVAEQYQADADYAPGTVLVLGGAQEVTASTHSHDTAVAGVVSQRPSYLMNAGLQTANSVPVALLGRVPCQVVGTITRGQLLVTSSTPGTATALDHTKYVPGCVIGKALEDYNSNVAGIIEIAVGIK